MIEVTRLDGSKFIVNALLIEFIESTPDTIISFTNGKKIIVKEPTDQIIEMTVDYLKRINSFALNDTASNPKPEEPSEESDEWI
jgi:flagellar protein FlbD